MDLERVFQEQLKAFFLSPEEVSAALGVADEELQAKEALLETLRRDAVRLKAEADEVYQLYLAHEITSHGFGERNTPIDERRVALEEEIPRLQREIDFLRIQHLSEEQLVSEAEDLYNRWDDLSPEEKRGLVSAIVERVTVGKDETESTLAYLPRTPTPPSPPPLKMVATYPRIPRSSWRQGGRTGRGSGSGSGPGRR